MPAAYNGCDSVMPAPQGADARTCKNHAMAMPAPQGAGARTCKNHAMAMPAAQGSMPAPANTIH